MATGEKLHVPDEPDGGYVDQVHDDPTKRRKEVSRHPFVSPVSTKC